MTPPSRTANVVVAVVVYDSAAADDDARPTTLTKHGENQRPTERMTAGCHTPIDRAASAPCVSLPVRPRREAAGAASWYIGAR